MRWVCPHLGDSFIFKSWCLKVAREPRSDVGRRFLTSLLGNASLGIVTAAADATITNFPFGCGREEFLGFNTKMLCRLVFSENVEEEHLLSNLVFSFNLLPLRNPKRKRAITNSFLGSLSAMLVFTLYLKNCRNKHHLLPNTLSKIKASKTSEPGFTKIKKKKTKKQPVKNVKAFKCDLTCP